MSQSHYRFSRLLFTLGLLLFVSLAGCAAEPEAADTTGKVSQNDDDGDETKDPSADDDKDTDDKDDDSDDATACIDEDKDGYGLNCDAGPDCDDADATIHTTMTAYTDADGDGVTVGGQVEVCAGGTLPAGYLAESAGEDCDDGNAGVHTLVSGWADGDGDLYTSAVERDTLCTDGSLPSGYVADVDLLGTDCDDGNAYKHTEVSGYVDADGDSYAGDTEAVTLCTDGNLPSGYLTDGENNGLDCNDADHNVFYPMDVWVDADNDGYTIGSEPVSLCTDSTVPSGYQAEQNGLDCDDGDAALHTSMMGWVDSDNDGYTVGASAVAVCTDGSLPTGYQAAENGPDCDDGDNRYYSELPGYPDADDDGYTVADAETVCAGAIWPAGYAQEQSTPLDCNDGDVSVHTLVDAWTDGDNDGYTVGSEPVSLCTDGSVPSGYQTHQNGLDCDDGKASVWYLDDLYKDSDGDTYTDGLSEVCRGLDLPEGYRASERGMDCDDEDPDTFQLRDYYQDSDGDGYTVGDQVAICVGFSAPAGYRTTSDGVDCNDADASLYREETLYSDLDGDGHFAADGVPACIGDAVPDGMDTTAGADCDDDDMLVRPGSYELLDDGIDQNCDGSDLLASDATGIYVDPLGGSDTTGAGTQASPVKSIMRAVEVAALGGFENLFLSEGTHWVTDPTDAADPFWVSNLSLYGGFDPNDWSRDPIQHVSEVINPGIHALEKYEQPAFYLDVSGGKTRIVDGLTARGIRKLGAGTAVIRNVKVNGFETFQSARTLSITQGPAILVNVNVDGGSLREGALTDKVSAGVFIDGTTTEVDILHSQIRGPDAYAGTTGVFIGGARRVNIVNSWIQPGSETYHSEWSSGQISAGVYVSGEEVMQPPDMVAVPAQVTLAGNSFASLEAACGFEDEVLDVCINPFAYFTSLDTCDWTGCQAAEGNLGFFDGEALYSNGAQSTSSKTIDNGVDAYAWYPSSIVGKDWYDEARPKAAYSGEDALYDIGITERVNCPDGVSYSECL